MSLLVDYLDRFLLDSATACTPSCLNSIDLNAPSIKNRKNRMESDELDKEGTAQRRWELRARAPVWCQGLIEFFSSFFLFFLSSISLYRAAGHLLLTFVMILGFVQVCYNSIHQPFASEGAVKIQNLNSERPALKIIRAVLRDSDIDPDEAVQYSMHRCYCSFHIKTEDGEEAFNSGLTLDELEIKDGDYVFFRKIDSRVDEMEVMSEESELLITLS